MHLFKFTLKEECISTERDKIVFWPVYIPRYASESINVCMSTYRREHLSQEDIQKNKAMVENLTKGSWDNKEVGGAYCEQNDLISSISLW